MMGMTRPRAVIFDLGSTLIDYPSSIWEKLSAECTVAARQSLIDRGVELPPEDQFAAAFEEAKNGFRRIAAETRVEWTIPQAAEKLFGKLGLPSGDDLSGSFFEAYYKVVREHISVYDDTVTVLEKIKESIGRIGLISNTIFPEWAHRDELKQFGIEEFLDFTIFSSTFGLRKPHPDIFYKGANLAGYAPEECVYIGDRYIEDITGPNGIGMPATDSPARSANSHR